MRSALSSFTIVVALATPIAAHAQDLGFGAHARPRGQAVIIPRWDTYAFGENIDGAAGSHTTVSSWANVFSAQLDFNQFVLNFAVPVGFAHTSTSLLGASSSDNQAELGNIELEGYADIDLGPEHRLLVGGGIALPTATDQASTSSFRGQLVRTVAWATSFRNPSAWADQSFGLWGTAAYRWASEWVLVTATGSIPFFFPTNGDRGGGPFYRGNVEMMLTLDVAGAVRIVNAVDAGVSFLGWVAPTGTGIMGHPDVGQTAATIFVRTDDALDLPVGGGFEMLFNLDNSWGPTGDQGKFWGAHIFIFGRFDVGASGTVTEADWDPSTDGATTTTEPTTTDTAPTDTTTTESTTTGY